MKILIPLLFLTLGVNANEVVYGSKSGTIEFGGDNTVKLVDVAAGETVEILNVIGGSVADGREDVGGSLFMVGVKHGELPIMGWQKWNTGGSSSANSRDQNQLVPVIDNVMVGPCTILLAVRSTDRTSHIWQVSYKLTKPSAANTTTSAPILLPPTQDAAKSWFVKLQVSSDLKAWDDVAPGQFLGSDTARFFRIQTTEAE
jgi:hypothetical protein